MSLQPPKKCSMRVHTCITEGDAIYFFKTKNKGKISFAYKHSFTMTRRLETTNASGANASNLWGTTNASLLNVSTTLDNGIINVRGAASTAGRALGEVNTLVLVLGLLMALNTAGEFIKIALKLHLKLYSVFSGTKTTSHFFAKSLSSIINCPFII